MKIKGCSLEEASSLFSPTPMSFNTRMQGLLGSGGAVMSVSSDRCGLHTPDS